MKKILFRLTACLVTATLITAIFDKDINFFFFIATLGFIISGLYRAANNTLE